MIAAVLFFALAAQDAPICGVTDPEAVTDGQRACLDVVTEDLLAETPGFLDDDTSSLAAPVGLQRSADCPNLLAQRVSPAWPTNLPPEVIDGRAMITFDITEDGSTARVQAISASHPDFGRAGARAVERWRYDCPRATLGETTEFLFVLTD